MSENTDMSSSVREKVYERIERLTGESGDPQVSDDVLKKMIDDEIYETGRTHMLPIEDRERIKDRVFFSIRGLDALESLLADDSVTEIMVNGVDEIFIERKGRIEKAGISFESKKRLEDTAQKIASRSDKLVNTKNPILDTRLPDGSRVNIVLPPVAVKGPVITIRKFYDRPLTIEALLKMKSITFEAAEFLKHCVKAGCNIFVSGGTGSGKTTFLNILSEFIPSSARVITIEDSAELKLQNVDNLISLEARGSNTENENAVSIRDLIKTSLRMRPDRIVVGEVRGDEAIDMLQAMNTGHAGSMSTGHANSAQDMMTRLETMVLMGMDMPVGAVREQIAAALDLVVHIGRIRDKSRRVLEISDVRGVENGCVKLVPLYRFEERGEENGSVIGALKRTDAEFKGAGKLKAAGIRY